MLQVINLLIPTFSGVKHHKLPCFKRNLGVDTFVRFGSKHPTGPKQIDLSLGDTGMDIPKPVIDAMQATMVHISPGKGSKGKLEGHVQFKNTDSSNKAGNKSIGFTNALHLGEGKYLITAHGLKDTNESLIADQLASETSINTLGSVLRVDKNLDLGIVQNDLFPKASVKFSTREPKLMEVLYLAGFDAIRGRHTIIPVFYFGKNTMFLNNNPNIQGEEGLSHYLVKSFDIKSKNISVGTLSGSPVFNKDGQVVGTALIEVRDGENYSGKIVLRDAPSIKTFLND